MKEKQFITLNGKKFSFENEANLLELIRKCGFELPTFCYHSELSVYGACRLCLVDIEGMGIQPACSTKPKAGMNIKTMTDELRNMRKIIVELLLANESHDCPTCSKNGKCQLQDLARKLGIKEIRFQKHEDKKPIDDSSFSIVRDPNKCVLCGDCVRVCSEVQSVGAIDFAYRGKEATVMPSFGKNINEVECVLCGQCARVCPTGALSVKSEINQVWKEINNPEKIVVAQIAPAVRVGIKEIFDEKENPVDKLTSALKMMGFDKVFDTSTAADLTVLEESEEFIKKLNENKLPLFTSCCPAWVKFAQQYYPEMLEHISSCKSPQGMFGSILKEIMPGMLNVKKENITVVSIMPCSAKKYEARKKEPVKKDMQDNDFVLTTEEIAKMIEEAGLDFKNIKPEKFDSPFSEASSAGLIFGNSGGVTEAVLRFLKEKLENKVIKEYTFDETRINENFKEVKIILNNKEFSIAIVSGLANARKVLTELEENPEKYHFVEVMACPGGCIGGAGQPTYKNIETRCNRVDTLYDFEKSHKIHKAQNNADIIKLYDDFLNKGLKNKKHELLHTEYSSKKRIIFDEKNLSKKDIEIKICLGTNCFLKGSENIMKIVTDYINENELENIVGIKPVFCFENCEESPNVMIEEKLFSCATPEKIIDSLEEELKKIKTKA